MVAAPRAVARAYLASRPPWRRRHAGLGAPTVAGCAGESGRGASVAMAEMPSITSSSDSSRRRVCAAVRTLASSSAVPAPPPTDGARPPSCSCSATRLASGSSAPRCPLRVKQLAHQHLPHRRAHFQRRRLPSWCCRAVPQACQPSPSPRSASGPPSSVVSTRPVFQHSSASQTQAPKYL